MKKSNIFNLVIIISLFLFIAEPTTVLIAKNFISKNTPDTLIYFISILLAPLAYLITYWCYKFIKGIKFNLIEFLKEQVSSFKIKYFKGVLYGLGLFFIIIVFNILYGFIVNYSSKGTPDNVSGLLSVPIAISIIIGGLIIPFTEEIVFRAGLRNILKDVSRPTYMFLSSLTFALVHIQNLDNIVLLISSVITAFISGLFLSYIFEKNKNIFPSFFAHSTYNTIILLIQFSM